MNKPVCQTQSPQPLILFVLNACGSPVCGILHTFTNKSNLNGSIREATTCKNKRHYEIGLSQAEAELNLLHRTQIQRTSVHHHLPRILCSFTNTADYNGRHLRYARSSAVSRGETSNILTSGIRKKNLNKNRTDVQTLATT